MTDENNGWQELLAQGDREAAWDVFLARYRRLLIATIRRFSTDYDDVMDIFAHVCEALRADDLGRLRQYDERRSSASCSTWLVAVVRNLAVDWFRSRDGRKRMVTAVSRLSERHREIYQYVFHEACSHREAFERIASSNGAGFDHGSFVRELREVYDAVGQRGAGALMHALFGAQASLPAAELVAPVLPGTDRSTRLQAVLGTVPEDVRTAVLLTVVEEMPADDVARVVGWDNRKTVYNRVSRALLAMRKALQAQGVGPGDL